MKSNWNNAKKILPKNDDHVLITGADYCCFIGYYQRAVPPFKGGRWIACGGKVVDVTHWMDLPELPKKTSK